MRKAADLDFVVIVDRNGIGLTQPDPGLIVRAATLPPTVGNRQVRVGCPGGAGTFRWIAMGTLLVVREWSGKGVGQAWAVRVG
ncbi:hypothetical protein [Streptomyces antibioticus]|uniref:Uncharacterized protein n=1 Tax=Streptomyces antibioticus TaxID=1890 RepID=A0AAE6Y349_STRAT|nr:hypothetical protein [Streptomyces antibioticus]OOQ54808.1 hypothetical protein AFM16_01870 [Streptomyces antibioticus]QIT42453.1 hypothetical protein HCX60_02060 [Streptomyces antibioticus]